MKTYYQLTVQPDEPVSFTFATQEEYEAVLEVARSLPDVVVDEESSGALDFNDVEAATTFLKEVWG